MKIATCLLAIVYSTLAVPADVPYEAFEKEIVNPVKTSGLPEVRISGGYELAPHAAPYQAALLINGQSVVSGSLITTTRILTTAFNTRGSSYIEVRLGAHYYDQEEDTQVRITSTSLMVHEGFFTSVNGAIGNDLAIIFLPRAVTVNDYVKTIALAPADAGSYEGVWGLASGWGLTTSSSDLLSPTLRGVYDSVISNDECVRTYRHLIDANICTSGDRMAGPCDGDVASPLVYNGLLIGITMSVTNRGCIGLPSIYSRISSFRSWIDLYA